MISNKPFNLLKFQKELANEFNKLETITDDDNDTWVLMLNNDEVVVDETGNVNYEWWHNGLLKNKFRFKFDNGKFVIINSYSKAEEFKKILRFYFEKFNKFEEDLTNEILKGGFK